MTNIEKHDHFDPLAKIAQYMKDTPPSPLKALEPEYEIALDLLLSHLPLNSTGNLDDRTIQLARRLTRHFLFNYYTGFSLLKFGPAAQTRATPSARQVTLEAALRKLARVEPAREVMAEWFAAALERRIHCTLRDHLNAYKPILNPSRAVGRMAARIGLSDDLEVLGRMNKTMFKSLDYGLSGFALLVESTGEIRQPEFDELLQCARWVFVNHGLEEGPSVAEVMNVLAIPRLSQPQQKALAQFVSSLLNSEQFPLGGPPDEMDEELQDPVARSDRIFRDMGFSRPFRVILGIIVWLFRKQLREQDERSLAIQKELHPHPDEEELEARRGLTARLIRILAHQSEFFLHSLDQAGDYPSLDAALTHLSLVKVLARHERERPSAWPEESLKSLRESEIVLDKAILEYLIQLIYEDARQTVWVGPVLENVPELSEPAEYWLSQVVSIERTPQVLQTALKLGQNLAAHRRGGDDLQAALLDRLPQVALEMDETLDAAWMAWLVSQGRECLRRFIAQLAQANADDGSSALASRQANLLYALACEAERAQDIDAVTLAACWLVEPQDWSRSGQSLLDRMGQAEWLLGAADGDRSAQTRVAQLFEIAIGLRPSSRVALARVLRTLCGPDLALSLLERLIELATIQDNGDWSWKVGLGDRRALFRESIQSIAALKPLLPQALLRLREAFYAHEESRREISVYDVLTPAFIYEELMPRLTHPVSPESVPAVMDLVWQNHCGPLFDGESPCVHPSDPPFVERYRHPSRALGQEEWLHRYLHNYYDEGSTPWGFTLLCCLQALANMSDLDLPYQRVIWKIYRTSWHALTKSLCLLILGRQRPCREETVRELIRLLRLGPMPEVLKMGLQHGLRHVLFVTLNHISPPDSDLNYLYLCQSVAVDLVSTLVQQEQDDAVVLKFRRQLTQALVSLTSMYRYGMEPHLSDYGSLSGTNHIDGIAQLLATPQEGNDKLVWTAHPADRCYEALRDMIAAGLIRLNDRGTFSAP